MANSLRRVLVSGIAVALGCLAWSTSAAASPGTASASLGAGPGYLNRPSLQTWGPYFRLDAAGDITEFWSAAFGTDVGYQVGANVDTPPVMQSIFAGIRYNIDLFKYIPYVQVGFSLFSLRPGSEVIDGVDAGFRAGIGLNYRISRNWGVGGLVETHSVADNFPTSFNYTTGTFNLIYHFRL